MLKVEQIGQVDIIEKHLNMRGRQWYSGQCSSM